MNEFEHQIRNYLPEGLLAEGISTLQINLGRTCNLACNHCHLECSPHRSEHMSEAVMEDVISLVGKMDFQRVDVTGGAPELHPRLDHLLKVLHARGKSIQIRTNLTALLESGSLELIDLFKACGVSLVGSLPCYLAENVDAQRGPEVHARSIAALRLLNRMGYGLEKGLTLNLVYNPAGPVLPPPQSMLEQVYRKELSNRYGVSFNHLLTLTNMPLGRFRRLLVEEGKLDAYLKMLKEAFNPATLSHLMCRRQLSVDWNGMVYDCDFNLAIGMPVNHGAPQGIAAAYDRRLTRRRIMTDSHCFGCTAGTGSSCSGVLAEKDEGN